MALNGFNHNGKALSRHLKRRPFHLKNVINFPIFEALCWSLMLEFKAR